MLFRLTVPHGDQLAADLMREVGDVRLRNRDFRQLLELARRTLE